MAVVALQSRRDEEKAEVYQIFGRVHNFRAEEVATEAQLYRHAVDKPGDAGELVDAIALKIPPQTDQSFKFDMTDPGWPPTRSGSRPRTRSSGQPRLHGGRHDPQGEGAGDPAGNRYLADTLKTPLVAERADVALMTPDESKAEAVSRNIRGADTT